MITRLISSNLKTLPPISFHFRSFKYDTKLKSQNPTDFNESLDSSNIFA
jgi:hypothetical protein